MRRRVDQNGQKGVFPVHAAHLFLNFRCVDDPWVRTSLIPQLDPHRHVVRSLVRRARIALSTAALFRMFRRLRRQQQMSDADAVVALPGAGLIVPEVNTPPASVVARRASVEASAASSLNFARRRRQEQRVGGPLLGMGRPSRGFGRMTLYSPASTSGSSNLSNSRAWRISRSMKPSL